MGILKSKKHIWIGLGLLLVITLVLGWFVGRYIPGTPQDPVPSESALREASIPWGNLTSIAISEVEDIPFGTAVRVEGVTHGDKYTTPKIKVVSTYNWETKEVIVLTEAIEVEPDPDSERYSVEYPPFEMTVSNAKVVAYESFVDWYPDFESYPTNGSMRPGSKFVLVEAAVTNLSESEYLDLSEVQLWSDDLVQFYPGHMGNGYSVSSSVLRCIGGLPLFQDVEEEYQDHAYLTRLEPGETRTVTFPYQVFEEAFTDAENFNELDLSRFSLEVYDYDPATVYRFCLGA